MSKPATFWLTDEAIQMLEDISKRTKLKKVLLLNKALKK